MSGKKTIEAILIVTMLSNLLASFFVILLVQLNAAQREAASAQASRERQTVLCILQILPSERSPEAIARCKQ